MIVTLNASLVEKHKKRIIELFSYCKKESTAKMPDESFSIEKINSLISYLNEGRAYFFAELSDDAIDGFLWACRLVRDGEERMHILYFAVSDQVQNRGIGSALLTAVECEAKRLGLSACELNVHTHNERAMRFYERRGYLPDGNGALERITYIKALSCSV